MVVFSSSALAVSPLYENENQNVDIDLLLEKSLESWNNSKFNEAIFYLDEILEHDPNNILALGNKGGILMQLEKYDEALPYYEKIIEINPDFVEAINGKAAALHYMNRDVDALTTLYDAYKIDPRNSVTLKNFIEIVDKNTSTKKLDMFTAYATIEVRNSDDQLVGYTETHDLFFQHPLALMFLEDNAEWRSIEIDGKEFEVLEHLTTYNIKEEDVLAANVKIALKDIGIPRFYVIHVIYNGFVITNEDIVIVKIILLRPS